MLFFKRFIGLLCAIGIFRSSFGLGQKKSLKKVSAKPAVPASSKLTAKESFITGLLSGAAAGTTVDLILYPLDTVKTRLQATAGSKFNFNLFKGIFDGVAPAIVASAPCAAVFFGAYDSLKRILGSKCSSDMAPFVHSFAAAGADLTQSIVRAPFEVIKQKMQSGVGSGGALAVASKIMKNEGIRGFYRGWGALALRDLPFDIIEFPMYEYFKKEWARIKGSPLAPWQGSLCGSLAGGIAAGLTTPLDVVKTRLMTQTAGEPLKYAGIFDCLGQLVKEEGFGSLWAGAIPRMTSIALGGAIFFGAYEYAKAAIVSCHFRNKTMSE